MPKNGARLYRRVSNFVSVLREHGPVRAAGEYMERASEAYHDWRLGIRTRERIDCAELGTDPRVSIHYTPSDYRTIYKAFRLLKIRPGIDSFLDYGCGMGRVLTVAATFEFRKVIGVEIAPRLCEIARLNVERARPRLICRDIEIIAADAMTYAVPHDVNTIFFYSPFIGPVLAGVLKNIRESFLAAPRKLTIVYKNTAALALEIDRHPWLAKRHEFAACDASHNVGIFECVL
jgi:SAM-dependent methyltransferase